MTVNGGIRSQRQRSNDGDLSVKRAGRSCGVRGKPAPGTVHSTAFGGAISGSGLFIKEGAGTLILTGGNSYSGGTVVENGTLQLGNGGASASIAGDLFDKQYSHSIFPPRSRSALNLGMRRFDKLGSGVVTVTALDTYSGGTTIGRGFLSSAPAVRSGAGLASPAPQPCSSTAPQISSGAISRGSRPAPASTCVPRLPFGPRRSGRRTAAMSGGTCRWR